MDIGKAINDACIAMSIETRVLSGRSVNVIRNVETLQEEKIALLMGHDSKIKEELIIYDPHKVPQRDIGWTEWTVYGQAHSCLVPVNMPAQGQDPVETKLASYRKWWEKINANIGANKILVGGLSANIGELADSNKLSMKDMRATVISAGRIAYVDPMLTTSDVRNKGNDSLNTALKSKALALLKQVLGPGFVENNGNHVLIASTTAENYVDDPTAVLKVYEWKEHENGEICGLRQRCVFQDIPIWLLLNIKAAGDTSVSYVERDATESLVQIKVQTSNVDGWEYMKRCKIQTQHSNMVPLESKQCWERAIYDEEERDKQQYNLPTGQEWLISTFPHMLALAIAKRESTEGMVWTSNVKFAAEIQLGRTHSQRRSKYMHISVDKEIDRSAYRKKSLTVIVENMGRIANKTYHMWGGSYCTQR